eukprot:c5058_g1_i1.p1 GENE.c5058_g1_i1~~c5058_g1_i1.p1  ORF type:complete len:626 (-),score=127.96 c5058_g1_i1:59-1936(-)
MSSYIQLPEVGSVSLIRPSLTEVQLGEKKGTANQKWQWTREGHIESFLGRFLECESGSESGRWAIYASTKEQRRDAHERWRYLDDQYIEHVRTGLVLDSQGCPKWTRQNNYWYESYDHLSLGMQTKDPSKPSQKWTRTSDGYLENTANRLVLEINDANVDANCFNQQGLSRLRKYVNEGGSVDEEGDFLRAQGGPARVTRMWQAAYSGGLELLEQLKECGANLNHIASNRCNALCVVTTASSASHLQVARYLTAVGGCDPFLVGVGPVWHQFSSFAAAIVHMPQFAKEALTSRATQKESPFGHRYDFTGIELDETQNNLLTVKYDLGEEPISPLSLMVEHTRTDLLSTPVMQRILEIRWDAYGSRRWNIACFWSAVYSILFLYVSAMWPWRKRTEPVSVHDIVFLSLLFVTTIPMITTQRKQMGSGIVLDGFLGVTMMLESAFPLALLIHTISPSLEVIPELSGAICVVLAILWPLTPMLLALALRRTGPFLVGLKWVIWDVIRVVVFFAMPFAGLAIALFVIHSLSGGKVVEGSVAWYGFAPVVFTPETNRLLYTISIVVVWLAHIVLVVMVAVLIAVVSNTFSAVQSHAMEEWLLGRAFFLKRLPQRQKDLQRYLSLLKQDQR